MRRFAFLMGTALLLGAAPVLAQSSSVTVGPNGGLSSTTTLPGSAGKHSDQSRVETRDEDCRTVGSDGHTGNTDGSVSSTVTAGPNGVHSSSSGGPSVTVRSKDGRSVSSSSASSSSGGTTVVTGTGSGGDCTVYVNPDSTDRTRNHE